jgi:hypothetical protein
MNNVPTLRIKNLLYVKITGLMSLKAWTSKIFQILPPSTLCQLLLVPFESKATCQVPKPFPHQLL